jgi:hypothetical protein
MLGAMRLLIRIVARFVLLGSASLLVKFARMRARGRRVMAEQGIYDPIPLSLTAWLIVAAWVAAFCGAFAILVVA